MANIENTEDLGITEVAELLGCCRMTAYIRIRAGEIPGSRLIAGRLWVAPREQVLRYKELNPTVSRPRSPVAA